MQFPAFQQYFTHLPDSHRIGLLTLSVTLFWWLENQQGWRMTYPRWPHALTNATFTLTGGLVQLLLGYSLLKALNWTSLHQWGLTRHMPFANQPLVHFLAAFLILDLLEYLYHRLMHRYAYLWRFHAVHHADPSVDVSTVLREHPGETFIRLTFLVLWVFVSGVTFWALMARQFVQIISNVAAHAHYRLPDRLDQVLSWVLITPNAHHVHHHESQPFTDSNYGDVLSIWDRVFGTFRKMNAEAIVFGLDSMPEPAGGATFLRLLGQPFRPAPADEYPDLQVSQTIADTNASLLGPRRPDDPE
jgi:sterol desaturase/sphingolipid hydroxylase (fatty acid hydroxylase superfamily)